MTYTIRFFGRNYFLQKYNVTDYDYMRLVFPVSENGKYQLSFHDKKYFVENSERLKDFSRLFISLENDKRFSVFLDITLYSLLPEVSRCNDDKEYSFLKCTRVNSLFSAPMELRIFKNFSVPLSLHP